MKRSRFSEEQIIGILNEHQAGMSAGDLCRKHGISDATFYTWRKKYGGMELADTQHLKELEEKKCRIEEDAGQGDAGEEGPEKSQRKKTSYR